MSLQRFSAAVAVLLTLLLNATKQAAASWHPNFILKPRSNLKVEAEKDSLHFFCEGSEAKNRRAVAELPDRIPSAGTSATFYIEAVSVEATRIVSFNIFRDVTLRWTKGGDATWVSLIDGEIQPVGPSKVIPGTGKHSITYVRGSEGFLLVEDGEVIVSEPRPRSKLLPSFAVSVWATGASFDIWITEIQIHYGLAAAQVKPT